MSQQPTAVSDQFKTQSGQNQNSYDKVIIGGGPAGLFSAYEILSAAKAAGKTLKVAVLTDTIHAPSAAGSNIVFGLDGYETSDDPLTPRDHKVLKLVRNAMPRLQEIVHKNNINCRMDMDYQLIGSSEEEVQQSIDFLENRFDYTPADFHRTAARDRIKFKNNTVSVESNAIGEINIEELELGLVKAIRDMGGKVITGTHYTGHEKNDTGGFTVETDKGTYQSLSAPLLATGPALVDSHRQLPAPLKLVYTGAMHVQLTPDDAAKVSRKGAPMGFADTHLDGDVLWGGLDRKGVLTIGFGDNEDPSSRAANETALRRKFAELLPEIAARYAGTETFSFGPMLKTDNFQPLVGRLGDCDINAAWASRGIVQSLAAAGAYADYYVNGNDADLRLFESLNPHEDRAQSPAPQPSA